MCGHHRNDRLFAKKRARNWETKMTKATPTSFITAPSRRQVLKAGGAAVLTTPFVSRAWAATTEINMLAWYGHGEPDVVAEYEAANNVKFVPKYYAGGDNMLALIAQSPPGTYDIILSDAEFVQQLNLAGYIDPLEAGDYPLDDMLQTVPRSLGRRQAIFDDGPRRAPRRVLQQELRLRGRGPKLRMFLEARTGRQSRPLRLAPAEPWHDEPL
jgi:hypothetical protein